jgi:hypothetical protein
MRALDKRRQVSPLGKRRTQCPRGYQLAGEQLETRSTSTTVEVFHRGKRVASQVRSESGKTACLGS